MKIHISEQLDKTIQGFSMIPIIYGEVDLSNIPNNAASTIVAIDAVDSINAENISTFIQSVVQKMRLNCELYIGGTDAYAISRGLVSGSLNLLEYNSLISGKRGIYSSKYILDLLQSMNIRIQSVVFKEYNYEISAVRQHDKN